MSVDKFIMEYPAAKQLADDNGYELFQTNTGQYDLVAPRRKGFTRLVVFPKKHYVLNPTNENSNGIKRWPAVIFDKEKFSLIEIVDVAIQTLEKIKR